jgi:hypothetical protein
MSDPPSQPNRPGRPDPQEGLAPAAPTWLWPNRALDIDYRKLSVNDRERLDRAAFRGPLRGLDHYLTGALVRFDAPSAELTTALERCRFGWHKAVVEGDSVNATINAHSWHLVRERMELWPAPVFAIREYRVAWWRMHGGCAGDSLYATFCSIFELERYIVNWTMRLAIWLNWLAQQEALGMIALPVPDGATAKERQARRAWRYMYSVPTWWSFDPVEVFERAGRIGDQTGRSGGGSREEMRVFTWWEFLMRRDEYVNCIEWIRFFHDEADRMRRMREIGMVQRREWKDRYRLTNSIHSRLENAVFRRLNYLTALAEACVAASDVGM